MEPWESPPDRDQVMGRIAYFINRAIGLRRLPEGEGVAFSENATKKLEDAIMAVLDDVAEDHQLEEFSARPPLSLVDAFDEDVEESSDPQFSGGAFVCTEGEEISLRLSICGSVSPLRAHFKVVRHNTHFLLLFYKISKDG